MTRRQLSPGLLLRMMKAKTSRMSPLHHHLTIKPLSSQRKPMRMALLLVLPREIIHRLPGWILNHKHRRADRRYRLRWKRKALLWVSNIWGYNGTANVGCQGKDLGHRRGSYTTRIPTPGGRQGIACERNTVRVSDIPPLTWRTLTSAIAPSCEPWHRRHPYHLLRPRALCHLSQPFRSPATSPLCSRYKLHNYSSPCSRPNLHTRFQ